MELYSAPDLGPLAALWAQAAQPEAASCFQSFAFARCWGAVFGSQTELRVLSCSEPACILPWAIRNGTLSVLGHGLFDYCDVIAAPSDADGLRDLVPTIAAQLMAEPDWERMDVCAVRGDSPFLDFWRDLAAALAGPGTTATFERYSAAPRLVLCSRAATGEGYDAVHTRAAGRLRQARRRGRLGGPVMAAEQRRERLAWMLAQKERRLQMQGQRNVLRQTEAEWLQQMAARHPELTEIWTYDRDGAPLAGFLTFLHPPVRYGYLLAFDPDQARFSPAITLLYFVLRQTVAEGWEFDFLTGEQPYKLRFANCTRSLLRLRVPRAPPGILL